MPAFRGQRPMFADYSNLWHFATTLATVAASLMAIAIWAGIAKWPAWHWRGSALLAAIALLIPIECYEPGALFLIAMPATFLGTLFLDSCCSRLARKAECPERGTAIRFSLLDVFRFVFLLATWSAIFSYVYRRISLVDWPQLIGLAGLLSIASVLLSALVLPFSFRIKLGTFVSAMMLCVASIYLPDPLLLREYVFPSNANSGIYTGFVFLLCLSVLSLMLIWVAFAAHRWKPIEGKLTYSVRLTARTSLGVLAVILTPCLIFTYGNMLRRATYPADSFPAENSLPRVLSLAEQLGPYKYPEAAVVEVAQPTGSAFEQTSKSLYIEIMEALKQDGHTPLPHSKNAHADLVRVLGVKYHTSDLARRWEAEAKAAASAGQFDRTVDYCLAMIRMGHYHARGGTTYDALVGAAISLRGLNVLGSIRTELSLDQKRNVVAILERMDNECEEETTTITRERAFLDRAFTWRRRLDTALNRHRGDDNYFIPVRPYRNTTKRRSATLHLLRADIAIRLSRDAKGEFPYALPDLVPEYLSSLPTDPYSGVPLIYRLSGNSYVLYSVWDDGVDNGGRLMDTRSQWREPGFDFDLDAEARFERRGRELRVAEADRGVVYNNLSNQPDRESD